MTFPGEDIVFGSPLIIRNYCGKNWCLGDIDA